MHLTLGWGRVRWRAGGCSAGAQKEYSPQVYKHPLTSSSLSLAGSIYQAQWWAAWRLPSAQALIGVSGVATFLPWGLPQGLAEGNRWKAKNHVLPKVQALVFQPTGSQGL